MHGDLLLFAFSPSFFVLLERFSSEKAFPFAAHTRRAVLATRCICTRCDRINYGAKNISVANTVLKPVTNVLNFQCELSVARCRRVNCGLKRETEGGGVDIASTRPFRLVSSALNVLLKMLPPS